MDVQTRADRPGYEENLRSLLKEVPLVLARSFSLKDRLLDLGCPAEKIRINRTRIPMEAYPLAQRPRPADGAWHFVAGVPAIEKGLDVALHAFARFAADHPNARFTIAVKAHCWKCADLAGRSAALPTR